MLSLIRSRRLLQDLARRHLRDLNIPPRNVAAAAALAVALALGVIVALCNRPPAASVTTRVGLDARATPAPHSPPTAEIVPPDRHRFPTRESLGAPRPGAAAPRPGSEGSGGWWVGTVGVALALALVGWGSVAARRFLPRVAATGPVALRVVGRTSLSPRHTVYLLDVGGRVLILGTGPQGAPSVLGELADPADLARVDPQPRFDHRLGDES